MPVIHAMVVGGRGVGEPEGVSDVDGVLEGVREGVREGVGVGGGAVVTFCVRDVGFETDAGRMKRMSKEVAYTATPPHEKMQASAPPLPGAMVKPSKKPACGPVRAVGCHARHTVRGLLR